MLDLDPAFSEGEAVGPLLRPWRLVQTPAAAGAVGWVGRLQCGGVCSRPRRLVRWAAVDVLQQVLIGKAKRSAPR